jgi:N-carbamoyl-L-amino-acid hydrolase
LIDSYLELHIEPGPILEDNKDDIGVVRGVVGMQWLRVTITGEADHAGTTPMHDRCDALATATTAIDQIRTLTSYLPDNAVLTVGELEVKPSSINIIPEKVMFTIDIRCYDDDVRADAVEQVKRELSAATSREGTSFEHEEIMSVDHTEFSPRVQDAIVDAADAVNADWQSMVSGAGHDAMYINDITETAMIFAPSVDGKSHREDEYTEWNDVVRSANVYVNAAFNLAQEARM